MKKSKTKVTLSVDQVLPNGKIEHSEISDLIFDGVYYSTLDLFRLHIGSINDWVQNEQLVSDEFEFKFKINLHYGD